MVQATFKPQGASFISSFRQPHVLRTAFCRLPLLEAGAVLLRNTGVALAGRAARGPGSKGRALACGRIWALKRLGSTLGLIRYLFGLIVPFSLSRDLRYLFQVMVSFRF